MKKRAVPLLLLVALLCLCRAAAAGGDAGDPLVSLDYLTNVFTDKALAAAQNRLDQSGGDVYARAESGWRSAVGAEYGGDFSHAATWQETRLKRGDVLMIPSGAQVLLLAGAAQANVSSGALVDATSGVELSSEAALGVRHRCIAAEDSTVQIIVTSRTAVIDHCGAWRVEVSGNTPDYNAMARALRSLSLFCGSDTGYGEGFDLETAPNRIQALVMLIRLLGEEDEALACTASVPFNDVSASYWGHPYIAYAYEKGYTNGVEGNRFAPGRAASAGMFVEFVLRALGYSNTAQTDVSTATLRALAAEVITGGEKTALDTNEFLRADVVYLSWYALNVPMQGEAAALHQKLEAAGVFTDSAYRDALVSVASARL